MVKNLKLTNSYFYSSTLRSGSIVGWLMGNMDTVYSDAIVVGNANAIGGLVGIVGNSGTTQITMNNCWFDGSVTNKSTSAKYTGGLAGHAYSKTLTLTNCLNTATIDASAHTTASPCVGGLIGYYNYGTMTVNTSVNAGTVKYNTSASTTGRGGIVGYAEATNVAVNMSGVYYMGCTWLCPGNTPSEGYTKVDSSTISTESWFELDFDTVWEMSGNATPILQCFGEERENWYDTSWYDETTGEASDPYILLDRADLYGFAELSKETDFAGKTIKLGADITVNNGSSDDWADKTPAYQWTPIGSSSKPFAGTFDGLNSETGEIYSISGIYHKATSEFSGLFAATASGSTIKNLKLTNSYFTTTYRRFGSIVGCLAGNLDTIYSDATVVGNAQAIGGLVGIVGNSNNTNVEMTKCWFGGSVTNTSTNQIYTGGLIGHVYTKTLTMTNCLNTATVDTSAYTTANAKGYIVPYVGGLIGYHASGTLTVNTSVNTGTVAYGSATHYRGAIVGYAAGTVEMSGVYYMGCTWLCPGATPSAGYTKVDSSTISTETWSNLDFDTYWQMNDETPILKTFGDEMESWYDTSWYDDAVADENENEPGSEANPYIIYDRADLYGLADLSKETDFAGKTIKLGADIIVNNGNSEDWADKTPAYQWIQIGSSSKPFAGTFDGLDEETNEIHTISGIYFNTSSQYGGLFAATASGSTIQNLKVTNSYFYSSAQRSGSIAGWLMGNLDTIYSDATVVGNANAIGGLVGIVGNSGNTEITMDNCWFDGKVTNSLLYTGGLAGHVYTKTLTMTNCLNTATVDTSAYTTVSSKGYIVPYVGGFIGYHANGTLTVNTSVNLGTVEYGSATHYRGGIVGYAAATVSISGVYYRGCTWLCPGQTIDASTYTKVDDLSTETWENLNFETDWAIISERTTPVLAAFADVYAGSSPISYTLSSEKVSLAVDSSYTAYAYNQGGCYAVEEDGTYYYQTYIITYGGTSHVIVKYDLEGNIVSTSGKLELGHGNDMTYNSKTRKLVVCHAGKGVYDTISIIDPSDWSVETKQLDCMIYSIDYNATYDCYAVGVAEYHYVYILDSEFNIIDKYTNVKTDPKGEYTTTLSPQGMSCDDQYIYYLYSGSDGNHVITVFDWDGVYITELQFAGEGEPENISVVDDKIYVSIVGDSVMGSDKAYLYILSAPTE